MFLYYVTPGSYPAGLPFNLPLNTVEVITVRVHEAWKGFIVKNTCYKHLNISKVKNCLQYQTPTISLIYITILILTNYMYIFRSILSY
jgi:hypothetical protein